MALRRHRDCPSRDDLGTMRTLLASLLFVAVAACGGGGGDDTQNPDAPPGQPDAPAGALCTGLPYDKCADTTNWTDCMNGMECRFFMGDGITECTPTCDGANPCPNDEAGNPVTCNMMGRCKANPPNSCTLP